MSAVEPKTREFLDAGVLSRLMHVPLASRFPMVGHVAGHHKSPHRGSSVEFAEYRNYVPGDDLRRLDWRVLGRTDRYYTKETEADTNLRCYIVLDCSASMNFASKHGTKLAYARRLAGSLAYLTVIQGDAAGLTCVGGNQLAELPPRRNPSHLQLVFDHIEKVEPRGETKLIAALHELAERVQRRALVVVISDLFCDAEEVLRAFQHLRFQKHDLAVFQLLDRLELDFNFDRPMRFQDLEGPVSIVTEPVVIRDEYLDALERHRARLRDGCNELNTDFREIVTDQGYEKVLADFLTERARLHAGG
jgi:uncharacterized protein (DUF58 family)